jgi:hypothetical protein
MIKCIPWKPYIPTHRTNLHDRAPTPLRIDLAKHPQRLLGHIHGPPKVRLHLPPSVRICRSLKIAPEAVPRVVDYDVDATELLLSGCNGGCNFGGGGGRRVSISGFGGSRLGTRARGDVSGCGYESVAGLRDVCG